MKSTKKKSSRKFRDLPLILLGVIVLICVFFAGYFVSQQQKALDRQRQADLQDIITKYQAYLSQNSAPPKSLDEVYSYYNHFIDKNDNTTPPVDPETKKKYTYKVLSKDSYQLCSDFSTAADTKIFGYSGVTDAQGNRCFTINFPTKPSSTLPYSPSTAPTAVLTSLDKKGSCEWIASFSIKGFTPNSPVRIHAYGRLSDGCDPAKTHDYDWTQEAVFETGDDGTGSISYAQRDYGIYTYAFTDVNGKSASVTFSYNLTPTPTPR